MILQEAGLCNNNLPTTLWQGVKNAIICKQTIETGVSLKGSVQNGGWKYK